MRVKARLSVYGLWLADNQLFDPLQTVIPEGVAWDNLVNTILLECSELETRYPHPAVMKTALTEWATRRKDSWERIAKAFFSEYNPIHNFDRNEEIEDNNEVTNTPSSTSTFSTAAYNTGLTPKESQTMSGEDKGESKYSRKAHLFGNIGITRTQEMISDELELRKQDFVHIICTEFKEQFCILVY